MKDIEMIAFKIISNAGDVFSHMYEALQSAKKGNWEESDRHVKTADEKLKAAHLVQTDLIQKEAQGEKTSYSILMVHAQDHLANAILSQVMFQELIEIYRNKK
ncbi:PTS lactose/cellobiose transporter subunit IIA [Spiroplasma sp. DGKH1]|uniref:PTS lactose/cellobiose transporter subunit IIA n=1 Tax=Spiroplasma sp. DGKH1 TaxID=3050074 RepID=UPI0034C69C3F